MIGEKGQSARSVPDHLKHFFSTLTERCEILSSMYERELFERSEKENLPASWSLKTRCDRCSDRGHSLHLRDYSGERLGRLFSKHRPEGDADNSLLIKPSLKMLGKSIHVYAIVSNVSMNVSVSRVFANNWPHYCCEPRSFSLTL